MISGTMLKNNITNKLNILSSRVESSRGESWRGKEKRGMARGGKARRGESGRGRREASQVNRGFLHSEGMMLIQLIYRIIAIKRLRACSFKCANLILCAN